MRAGPLVDPVEGAPSWVPNIHDEASITRLRRAIWLVLAVGVVAFIARGANRPDDPTLVDAGQARIPVAGFAEVAVALVDAAGAVVEHCVLAADTPDQRARGLAGVPELVGYAGMLFRFPEPTTMPPDGRGTVMPLSMAYFDRGGALVGASEVPPCPTGTAECTAGDPPPVPISYALQVPQGELAPLGVTLGARLEVRGACPPP